jgi:hypothetical protein
LVVIITIIIPVITITATSMKVRLIIVVMIIMYFLMAVMASTLVWKLKLDECMGMGHIIPAAMGLRGVMVITGHRIAARLA